MDYYVLRQSSQLDIVAVHCGGRGGGKAPPLRYVNDEKVKLPTRLPCVCAAGMKKIMFRKRRQDERGKMLSCGRGSTIEM